MDFFALLPSEITQLIFDNLDPDDEDLRSPLSKRLLPFQRRCLFRRIVITEWSQMKQACQASQRRSSPLQHIQALQVKLPPWRSRMAHERTLRKPTNPGLRRFLRSLVQLKTLDLNGLQPATPILLDPIFAASSLPNLTSLALNTSSADFKDPFDPVNFAALAHYTNLSSFVVSDDRSLDEILPNPNTAANLDLSRSKVCQVSLSGALTTYEVSPRRLLASFDHLERLSLEDDSETSRLYDLLDEVKNPEGLKELRLAQTLYEQEESSDSNFLQSVPVGNLGRILLRFPSLSSLTLGNLCDVTSPSFYRALRQLSLDHLAFKEGAKLSLAKMRRLVESGGMKHKLKTIRFDNVEGTRGTPLPEPDGSEDCFDMEELIALEVASDWVLPKWTAEFDEESFYKFRSTARLEGIQVTGGVTQAPDIEEDYRRELDHLDEYKFRLAEWGYCDDETEEEV